MRRSIAGLLVLIPLMSLWAAFLRGDLQTYKVISRSMAPTLEVGDCVLMRRESEYADLKSRIVAFRGDRQNEVLTKRVVASDTDTVEVRGGKLFINGVADSSVSNEAIKNVNDKRWLVGDDEVFVVGDNRNRSYDSVDHGPVARTRIIGVITFRYWPPGRIGSVY